MKNRAAGQDSQLPSQEEGRRRLGKIVHDDKGTASVEWHEAPADYERPVLEIEGQRTAPVPSRRGLDTGSLAVASEDTHNPYTRIPGNDHSDSSGQRTDLRKLSAWIKMMRKLEEAKKRNNEE